MQQISSSDNIRTERIVQEQNKGSAPSSWPQNERNYMEYASAMPNMRNPSWPMMPPFPYGYAFMGTDVQPSQNVMYNTPEPQNEQTSMSPVSEPEVQYKTCTLYTPNADIVMFKTRDKPQGCKAIVVSGYSESCTETVLKDVFERCGEIVDMKYSKNSCFIRFAEEIAADRSVMLSGSKIKLRGDTKYDDLIVEYKNNKQDKQEWRSRKTRWHPCHDNNNEETSGVHFTEKECGLILEKLKSNRYMEAIPVIVHWLDHGSCTKNNANIFYNLIQTCTSQIKRLSTQKKTMEDEYQSIKEMLRSQVQNILHEVNEIEKLYSSSSHKKVWDHFTKPQRKHIDMWKKMSAELKNWSFDADLKMDTEMDLSDNEDSSASKKSKIEDPLINSLQEENSVLRCQMEALKNEIDVTRIELQCEIQEKDTQLKRLQNFNLSPKRCDGVSTSYNSETGSDCVIVDNEDVIEMQRKGVQPAATPNPWLEERNSPLIAEKEAKILSLTSIFLHIHPLGATLGDICSYLHMFVSPLDTVEVESLLQKLKTVFQQDTNTVKGDEKQQWRFVGFGSDVSQTK